MEFLSNLGSSLITLFIILAVAAIVLLLARFIRLAVIARKARARDEQAARRDERIVAQMKAEGFTTKEARDAINQLPH